MCCACCGGMGGLGADFRGAAVGSRRRCRSCGRSSRCGRSSAAGGRHARSRRACSRCACSCHACWTIPGWLAASAAFAAGLGEWLPPAEVDSEHSRRVRSCMFGARMHTRIVVLICVTRGKRQRPGAAMEGKECNTHGVDLCHLRVACRKLQRPGTANEGRNEEQRQSTQTTVNQNHSQIRHRLHRRTPHGSSHITPTGVHT